MDFDDPLHRAAMLPMVEAAMVLLDKVAEFQAAEPEQCNPGPMHRLSLALQMARVASRERDAVQEQDQFDPMAHAVAGLILGFTPAVQRNALAYFDEHLLHYVMTNGGART